MSFLKDLSKRGLIHQVTDFDKAEKVLAEPGRVGFIGFDPTADSLHVGSLLQLTLIARLAVHGHKPLVLLGDGTGMVGDPSGKSSERTLQTDQAVQNNTWKIRTQIQTIMDNMADATESSMPFQFVTNRTWLAELNLLDFLRDTGKHFSVNAMIQRDSVKSRLETREQGISFTEFAYMLLQAQDFLELHRREDCQFQIGGSDQWGNIVSGTDLIAKHGERKPVFGLTVPLMMHKNGHKFGKTETGTIWLDPQKTSPFQFFQFWLNLADDEAVHLLKMLSLQGVVDILALEAAAKEEPAKRIVQKTLAAEMTWFVHGNLAMQRAAMVSNLLFGELPPDSFSPAVFRMLIGEIPTFSVNRNATVSDLLVGMTRPFTSRSELKNALKGPNPSVMINREHVRLEGLAEPATQCHNRFALVRFGKKFFLACFDLDM